MVASFNLERRRSSLNEDRTISTFAIEDIRFDRQTAVKTCFPKASFDIIELIFDFVEPDGLIYERYESEKIQFENEILARWDHFERRRLQYYCQAPCLCCFCCSFPMFICFMAIVYWGSSLIMIFSNSTFNDTARDADNEILTTYIDLLTLATFSFIIAGFGMITSLLRKRIIFYGVVLIIIAAATCDWALNIFCIVKSNELCKRVINLDGGLKSKICDGYSSVNACINVCTNFFIFIPGLVALVFVSVWSLNAAWTLFSYMVQLTHDHAMEDTCGFDVELTPGKLSDYRR